MAEPTATEIEQGFKDVQNHICGFFVKETGEQYLEDLWDYAPKGEGGGITRVWEGEPSHHLEKAGVNFSGIRGSKLPQAALANFSKQQGGEPTDPGFFATGVSLVIHPKNPMVPTVHMNIRYFEAGSQWWFGGGIDVTPYYPKIEQVIAFHQHLKTICEQHGESYADHKDMCDKYFFLKHRNETRGIGGIFFDHLKSDKRKVFEFVKALGFAFTDLYRPFFVDNLKASFTDQQREYQLLRRARYVEFNLLFDRGTKFGIESEGRTESILMSLPSVAKWKYNWKPEANSPEEKVHTIYLKAQNWLGLSSSDIAAWKL